MQTIDAQIWSYLRARVTSLVTSPVLPIFDPGDVVSPPSGNAPFLLLSDVRNDNVRSWISSDLIIRSGTLFLQVRWPLARPVTHHQLVQLAGTIADHFPADQCMGPLRVLEDASISQPDLDGAYRFVIVKVRWSTL